MSGGELTLNLAVGAWCFLISYCLVKLVLLGMESRREPR